MNNARSFRYAKSAAADNTGNLPIRWRAGTPHGSLRSSSAAILSGSEPRRKEAAFDEPADC